MIYQLLSEPGTIRVLQLLPAQEWTDEVKCRLKVVSLEDSNLQFQALSYTWGAPGTHRAITCEGESMLVTANLFSALARIRNQSSTVVIWIDAVCINQQDLRERESQVRLMGRIYRQASSVIVDLGDSLHSELLAPLLLQLQQMAEEHLETAEMEFGELYERYHLPESGSLDWKAWAAVITSPWFQRAWIIQEFAVVGVLKLNIFRSRIIRDILSVSRQNGSITIADYNVL